MSTMPKTTMLALATLLLAVAVLVTDLVSPYAGGTGGLQSAKPTQVEIPARVPVRVPVPLERREIAETIKSQQAI